METHQPEASRSLTIEAKQLSEAKPLSESIDKISNLIREEDVSNMISIQASAIERLEVTNKSLIDCNALAQAKLAATTKLFKKTAKQLGDAKRDLDYTYKKILDLKSKIRADNLKEVDRKPNEL